MPSVRFDRFYRYQELTELLRSFAEEHPKLVGLESIGRSHEGRDIWVLTVSNRSTGDVTLHWGIYVPPESLRDSDRLRLARERREFFRCRRA